MDFKKSSAGKVIKTPTGYLAFIPNPLPPELIWNNQLISCLSKADHILGMLSREGSRLPNPHLLMRPFIVREAVLSSKIEGTQTTLGEILADQAGAKTERSPDELQEIQNYIIALDYGTKR